MALSWFDVRAIASEEGVPVPPPGTPCTVRVEVDGVPCIFDATVRISVNRSNED
jgi:hypothetical protein